MRTLLVKSGLLSLLVLMSLSAFAMSLSTIALAVSAENVADQKGNSVNQGDNASDEEEISAVVNGKVFNQQSNEPIADVLIHLEPYGPETFTDEAGKFSLSVNQPKHAIEVLKLMVFKSGFRVREVLLDSGYWAINEELQISLEILSAELAPVSIGSGKHYGMGLERLRAVEGNAIYAGKKTEVIIPARLTANLAANNPRQLYARVTGLNIWESDAAGLQLGIGGRGLSPDRTANFNTRQNGYDISADAHGYPESYYTPPSEALERIEVVRGAASLQYGTQFGGLLNFVLKDAPKDRKLEGLFRQSFGSNGFFNSFNSLGGRSGDWSYYGFYQFKRGDGWRANAGFEQQNAYLSFGWDASESIRFSLAATHMNYLSKQAGGLTDALFESNPRQSIRNRNWFKVNWNLVNLNLDWKISESSRLNWRNFGLHASKDALGFLGQINRTDPEEERDLLSDQFRNLGSEMRFTHRYNFAGYPNTFLLGARAYAGRTFRAQGLADSTSLPNFSFIELPQLDGSAETAINSDFTFPSTNFSLFSENIFHLSKNFKLVPGIRLEHIQTQSEGFFKQQNFDLAGNPLLDTTIFEELEQARNFVLAGLGASYWMGFAELYGNFSQNYRAINFNDLRVNNPNLRIDPTLKDERGFSADIGIRGSKSNWLNFDFSLFLLEYSGRIGQVLRQDSLTFTLYRYRTNVADSRNLGLESYVEVDLFALCNRDSARHSLSVFGNFSWVQASYAKDAAESAVAGKDVELVPPFTIRAGANYAYGNFSTSLLVAHTAQHFTDATNATFTASAVDGLIPAYTVFDFSSSYSFGKIKLEAGINNLTNSAYFTRRASGYPGPGIIPSDGRSWYVGLEVKL